MFTHQLRLWIESLREGEIFFAKKAYDQSFSDTEEATFYQLIARLHKEGYLGKIAKGLYFRLYQDDPTRLPSDNNIISFFTEKGKKGTLVGAHKYAELGIIDDFSNARYELYTNNFEIKTIRRLGEFNVYEVNVDYRNEAMINSIYMLDIIEHIDEYENVNIEALREFISKFARTYREEIFIRLLNVKTYKKRNIYIAKQILDHYNVENKLVKFLNKASKYRESQYILQAIGE